MNQNDYQKGYKWISEDWLPFASEDEMAYSRQIGKEMIEMAKWEGVTDFESYKKGITAAFLERFPK